MASSPLAMVASGVQGASTEVELALREAQRALEAQEWAAAELWLERALMLQPENAQARLEWAQLLVRRGQTATGLALLISLRDDPRTTAAQAQRLQVLIASIPGTSPGEPTAPPRQPPPLRWQQQWEASIGHSRNPRVQPEVREVPITLPQGVINLPLLSAPQPGWNGGIRAAWLHPQGRYAAVQLQGVSGQSAPSIRMQGVWSITGRSAGFASAHHLADGSQRVQGGVQHQWRLPTAAPEGIAARPTHSVLSLQASYVHEPQSRRQGPSVRGVWMHAWTSGASLQLWADYEANQRADGPPSVGAVGALAELRHGNHLSLQLQVLEQKDQKGYSPLLNYNSPRHMKTLGAHAEWAVAGHLGDGLVLRLHTSQRLSNIPLFAWSDAGLSVLARRSF